MELTQKFFPDLSQETLDKLSQFMDVFRSWNDRINLVSRKDIEQLETHHLLHSLAVLKWAQFPEGTRILDVGTGGGFPGLPLAIVLPEVQFFLCDSIEKKIKALRDMIDQLELKNVTVVHKRAEKLESKWDYILGRAVTPIPKFLSWVQDNVRTGGPETFPKGVLYWKGTLYLEEVDSIGLKPFNIYDIEEGIPMEYFHEKFIIHMDGTSVQKAKLPELV